MRVISGTKKGHKLATVNSLKVRPTTDRTKKVIFDVLAVSIRNANVLDVFSGCGSLGIEALSRGAVRAVFVEHDHRVLSVLRQNLRKTDLQSKARIYATTADKALRALAESRKKFDFIFADPPYHRSQAQSFVLDVERHQLLTDEGWLIVEHGSRELLDLALKNLILIKEKKQGDTTVSFFSHG